MSAAFAPQVLVVTRSAALRDEVARLAEAVGLAAGVTEAPSVREWSGSALVVVGHDVTAEVARRRLPRRRGVVVALRDERATQGWSAAVSLGADAVVVLPRDDDRLLELFSGDAGSAGASAPVLAVVGGRGGAGATTLACALAVTAARRRLRTVLVDADPLGGGLELVLGAEAASGLRWSQLHATEGRLRSSVLTQQLPCIDGLLVLSCERDGTLEVPAPAMRSTLEAARSESDLVVVDLPRHLGAAGHVVLDVATVALMVVPAELRAAAAAARVAALVHSSTVDLQVVVRGPSPSGLDAEQLAAALGLPLSGELRAEASIDESLDRGDPPARSGRGPLARYCSRLLDSLMPIAASA